MAHKMVKYIDGHQPTMASLFDGIGGFPLVFSRAGAKPIWASEIEEFPIAVTKIRFPEEEEEEEVEE
jgi:site-specific DNA-cytosine methylase